MKKTPAPLTKKYSGRWWKSQIHDAESRRKFFLQNAEESIRVYNAHKQIDTLKDAQRRLNVWWYCINTLLPAYYSSTPRAEVNLRKRAGGIPYELGSVILERNTQYVMDSHFDFDKVGYQAALQFLLTGQAVLWARYIPKFEKVFQEIAIFKDPGGVFIDATGKPYDGDVSGFSEAPGGIFISSVEVEQKVDEKAILEVVQYNDYICSDARQEAEIEWQGRRAFLDRNQATDLFGADIASDLQYDSFPEVIKKELARKEDKYEGKAELFEIWCEATNKVYWIQTSGEKQIIEESTPPIKFEGFYPCSVIRQSIDPDSVIPVSDYAHVKDQILEVERLTTRIHALTQAIRTNFTYDSAMSRTIEQIFEDDLKGIPVDNWPTNRGRGGLQGSMEFAPFEPFANSLNTLQGIRQNALQQLYETLKVSDLLRGTSEQYKSATANRLENQWSSMGLIVRQNMFCKFVSDGIAKLGAIIAEQFEETTILDVADATALVEPTIFIPQPPMPEMGQGGMPPDELGMPSMPPPMPDKNALVGQAIQEIIAILRDNKQRNYRIQIASDSMIAIDQQQQQQEGAQLIETAGQFFEQMKGVIEQFPPLIDFSLALFQNMIRRVKGGKELDGLFSKALQQIGEIAKAKEEAAKLPPPPDPTMQEVQGRLQIAQIEAQARLQTAQMESQDRAAKNQLTMQEQGLRMQRDQLEAQLAIQKQQSDEYFKQQQLAIQQQEIQVKQSAVQVDMLKVQTTAQSEADKAIIKQEAGQMQNILEIQKLELEQMRIRLSESEKLMEERRLAADMQMERINQSMAMLQTKTQQAATQAVAQAERPKRKKRGTIITDNAGNPVGIEITEEPEKRVGKLITDDIGNVLGMEMD